MDKLNITEKTEFKKGCEPWNKGDGDYMKGEKNHFFGKNHTEENKELNRQVNLGKKCSKETIEKRRLKMLGHKFSFPGS